MDISTNFANSLNELMIINNLKPAILARESGCPETSISGWLTKGVFPKLPNLLRLSAYFDCSIDYILGLSSDKTINRRHISLPFSLRIMSILNEKNITKYNLAKNCGFHVSRFRHWLSIGNHPQTENLIIMCQFLNCSVEYLLGLSDIV